MTIKINGDNTVANPGFSGDDTDTGLQVGTDELKLVTGGTARATVDSDGNLGVGVTSPTAKLEVQGETTSASLAAHIKAGDGVNTGGLLVDGDADTGDYLIKARSNLSATPTDSDTKFVVHGDGLVEINSGYVTLNGNQIGGIQLTIADNAFATITPPRIGGAWIFVNTAGDNVFPKQNASGFAYVDFGNSPNIKSSTLNSEMEVSSSGPPTGTTGSDVHATLFAGGTSGKIYLENRLGASFTFQITFL